MIYWCIKKHKYIDLETVKSEECFVYEPDDLTIQLCKCITVEPDEKEFEIRIHT